MNPMQTAAPIAGIRAAEGQRPEEQRLFVDPHAHLFADAAPEVSAFFGMLPFFTEHVRLRTRFIDDAARRALAAGIRDIVLVGAGFDCRALRLPEVSASGARVVEVDHGAQLAEKRHRLAAAGVLLPAHVIHAPADLAVAGELERALGSAGISPDASLLWICEGLFGYLTLEQLSALAVSTGRLSGAGSMLVANYSGNALRPEFVSDAFSSGGWRVSAVPTFAELHRAHLGAEIPDGSEAYSLFEATR